MTYSVYLERENEADVRQDVERVLSERGLALDDDGRLEVTTGDGGSAEVRVADAELVTFDYVSLSPELAALMFAIAERGYRVFAENSARALTTSPAGVRDASPDGDWAVVLCSSPDAMFDVLRESFEGWVEYREQVVGGMGQGVLRRFLGGLRRRST